MGNTPRTLVASVVVGGLILLAPSNWGLETKTLKDGKQVQVRRCSLEVDGHEIWERYGPKILGELNSMFKDGKRNFYVCDSADYCVKL